MKTAQAEQLKERARATWAAGDYDAVVDYIWSAGDYDAVVDYIWSAGERVVELAEIGAGEMVLDVACGTGNAAIQAAQRGAKVTGVDLTPELFEAARRRAAEAAVELELVEGDAEALPVDDASFDVVISTFGCMFAPRHEVAAAEIVRVLRPGGRFAIASWTLDGSIGDFFRSMSALAPPPPEGFEPPSLWGAREHVEGLFEGMGVELRFEDAAVDFRFESIDAAIDEYYDKFPPIVMLRAALEPEGRGEEIREALRGVFDRANRGTDEAVAYPGEYLIALGKKT